MTLTLTRTARAKINIALHVTGQRDDGYHLLDSLVGFTDFGDVVSVTIAPERKPDDHSLEITGSFSTDLRADDDNLVLKAVRLLGGSLPALDIRLEKKLPVASGIGGGSADAAASLRAICSLLNCAHPSREAILSLGADVPVCCVGKTVRMSGIGEEISDVKSPSRLPIILANPGIEIATPAIFKALSTKNNQPLSTFPKNGWDDIPTFIAWVTKNRNDLSVPAQTLNPQITACLTALGELDGALISRMSGSGATCFALFSNDKAAQDGLKNLTIKHPDWWSVATHIF